MIIAASPKIESITNTDAAADGRLKSYIWIYLFLLIFEGAVRKWIPPLSLPFLLIRDPIALLIWYRGYRLRIGDARAWLAFYIFAFVITVLGLLQIIGDNLNPLIIIYGWRSYVLHFPVAIVIASLIDYEQLKKLGRWLLIISIPMTALMILQYLAPSDSFLNRGAAEGSEQITGALGHIRPAGTFSFITGPISFFPLVMSFCLWGFSARDLFKRWLLVAAAISLLIVIPVSISRTIAIILGLMLVVAFISGLIRGGIAFKPERLPQIALAAICGVVLIVGLARIPLIQDAITTFMARWTQAQGTTADNSLLQERAMSIFAEALKPVENVSILGQGIGAGSTVAAFLKDQELWSFEFGENALQREVYELGSWLGPIFIIARISLGVFVVFRSLRELMKGNWLPLFLMVPAALGITQSTFDQTTSQGFGVVGAGVWFASLQNYSD